MKDNQCKTKNTPCEKLIFFGGAFLRTVYFIINLVFVKGLHVDEAMTALNSFSLNMHGTDILGNHTPVYFATWISGGQSPVATYLCALSARLFGHNLFAVRFPSLMISIIGLAFFMMFMKELFKGNRLSQIASVLAAISPWFIFSGVYTLDCNYMPYMLIIACYFLIRAINTNKGFYYITAMLFMALCFYSYIAAVLIVPLLLSVLYLILLIKNRIDFKATLLSIVSLLIFSLPFIVFGFVSVGLIPEFSIFKISFGGMENYERANSLFITADGGITGILLQLVTNLATGLSILFIIDTANIAIGLNIFQFGNLFAGLLLTIGAIDLCFSCIKRKKNLNTVQKTFLLSFGFSILFFLSTVNDISFAYIYRYGVLSALLIPFEALGLFKLYNVISQKKSLKAAQKILAIYLAISVCIFNTAFFFRYAPLTKTTPDIIYSDSLFKCLDYCEEKGISEFSTVNIDGGEMRKESIFLRYYYGTDNLINFYDEHTQRADGVDGIKVSDKITMYLVYDGLVLSDSTYIVTVRAFKKIDASGFNVKEFGNYILLEK